MEIYIMIYVYYMKQLCITCALLFLCKCIFNALSKLYNKVFLAKPIKNVLSLYVRQV